MTGARLNFVKPHAAFARLRPGMRLFVHAGPSEPQILHAWIAADPANFEGVTFLGAFIPGLNATDYSSLAPHARVLSTFITPALSEGFRAGRVAMLPKSYSGFARWLEDNPPNVALLRVAPPGADGLMSFGLNQDYAPIAAACAKEVIALVDAAMPAVRGEPGLDPERCAALIEIEEPLKPFPSAPASGTLAKVGANAATLIRDGDTIQIGIGKVQSAILANFGDRRHLGLHSGMIDNSIAGLADAGVLDNTRKSNDRGLSVFGMAIGSHAAWDFAQRKDSILRSADYTHSAAVIGAQDNFTAINSALEVDLLGQCNAELLNGRQVSGAGGFHDFQRGALAARGGRCIVALPSSAGAASRIVARLEGAVVTGPRNNVDIIVTEHGTAHLRDLNVDARAEALIAIAAPESRSALADQWRDLRKTL